MVGLNILGRFGKPSFVFPARRARVMLSPKLLATYFSKFSGGF